MNTDLQRPNLEHAKAKGIVCRGFTLVELLVVISIIGILMAIVVGAIRGANQDTLVAKTRGTIAKIDSILNDRYTEYASMSLSFATDSFLDSSLNTVANPTSAAFRRVSHFPVERLGTISTQLAFDPNWNALLRPGYAFTQVPPPNLLKDRVRLAATRDMMRMEMPDCLGDLIRTPGTLTLLNQRASVPLYTGFTYRNGTATLPVVMQLQTPGRFGRIYEKLSNVPSGVDWSASNFNAELLYLIIEDSTLNNSSAIEAFGNSEIGDVDNDGLFELLDAWGKPIRWLRWPAGFNSEVSSLFSQTSDLPGFRKVQPFNPDPLAFPTQALDVLDPSQSDVGFDRVQLGDAVWTEAVKPGDALKALVVSAGPDGKFGIRFQWQPSVVSSQAWSSLNPQLFSTAAVQYPYASSPWPRPPLYWGGTGFNWPDPYHPRYSRIGGREDAREAMLAKLGGPLLVSYDGTNEIEGISLPSGNLITSADTTMSDTIYSEQANDNVTNLDESGASL
jgi:prepilin-type N-terminal cleavage/methylation domain-containing protein